MKKVNKDPFSNGTEHMSFEEWNCSRCIKDSKPKDDGSYTNADAQNMPNRCSILRDICIRLFLKEPINERTIKVCNDFTQRGVLCPYMKTERPKGKARKEPKEQLTLEL